MTPSARIPVPLGCGQLCHMVKMHFFKNRLLYSQSYIRQTYYKVIMTKEGSTKIINSMTPGTMVLVLGHGLIVNMQYFFSSSCPGWNMDQRNDDQGNVYQNFNILTPGLVVVVQRRCHISNIVKCIILYSISIVFRNCGAALLSHC